MPLILYTTPGAYSTVSLSPFCTKLECWLRMAEIPFETARAVPPRAPKGKIPYVDLDGTKMGDSQLVIEKLTREHDIRLDDHLTPAQRATGHLLRRALEEGTYFALVYTRWKVDAGFAIQRPVFASLAPRAIGWLIPHIIRRGAVTKLYHQGFGRHTFEEVQAMAIADLEAAATIFGDGPYLFGDRPTSYDATLFAFVDGLLGFPLDTPVRRRAMELGFHEYRRRVRERWFPHLEAPS